MRGRVYDLDDLEEGLTAYLMHFIQTEPGYRALQYVDVIYRDESKVVLFKHSRDHFWYSNGTGKTHLVLNPYLYHKEWYLTK